MRAFAHLKTQAQSLSSPIPQTRTSWLSRNKRRAAAGIIALLGLTACAPSGAQDQGPKLPQASENQSPQATAELTKVSYALDWAPNTNHIGVYVADALGYFADAGLEVEILPYGSVASTALVSAGEADFGVGGQAGVQLGRTAGLDLVSVYRVTQTDTGRLVMLAEREDLQRPADLDGLVFGGFGSPLFVALASATIKGDGGTGEFTEVVLDTGAYEALAQGRIDFTLSVSTWEDIQMEIDGTPYRAFSYQDFGVPQLQAGGIVSSQAYLDAHPQEARGFVQAVAKGYEYAVQNPTEAADVLIAANPESLGEAQELVQRSTALMATDGYLASSERAIGTANPQAWQEFGAFLFEGGFLVDSEGKQLTEQPDWSTYYTDQYLQ